MKLLLISVKSEISRGGIATWTNHFLANCDAENISCRLVNTDLVGRRALQESSTRYLLDEAVRTRRIFRELGGALKSEHFDAAHLNTSCGAFGLFRDLLIARRIKRRGIRLVTHFHCDISFWIRRRISRWALGKLAALSDERLVLCESSKQYLEDAFGLPSDKMPNFLDNALVLKEDRPLADTPSTVLFVGRVCEEKGAREIYSLATRLPQLTFRLVGALSKAVTAWDKPDNLVLVGSLDPAETLAEMDRADLFLLPSYSEGFSFALTEAMARGLPSVATDVGATADMLADGCGTVVPVGDVDAMEEAFGRLTDRCIRQEMSRRATSKVREKYATDRIIKQMKRHYGGNER